MTYGQIAWLPLCAGLTAVGIVLSYLVFRRRGMIAGLRAIAWSLLPLAAYLIGAPRTLWDIGTAIVRFVTGLVFSPMVWAGVVLAGLSAVLFVVSGTLRGRALSRARAQGQTAEGGAAGEQAGGGPKAKPRQVEQSTGSAGAGAAGDDFSDIEAILKRRGIE